MNITFLFFISLLLVAMPLLLLVSRSSLVFLMIFPASQMLGFLDPSIMAIQGGFDIHALLALIIVIAIVSSVARFRDLLRASLFRPMLILVLLWLYGVSAPILRGHSQTFLAIEASKEFMMVFSYFAVFLFLKTEKEVNWGWNILIVFGLYYSVIEILSQVLGTALMSHMTYSYRPEVFGLWKNYVPFWPLILLAFFHNYFSFALGITRPAISIAIGGAGLLFTFYRSYLLATIVSIPFVLLLSRKGINRKALRISIFVGILGVLIFGIMLVLAPTGSTLEKAGDIFIFSGAKEILGQEPSGSIAGREIYASQLRGVVKQHPLFGLGFINRDAEVVKSLDLVGFAGSTLGFIDKGNMDVLVKFGYIGGLTLYAAFLYILSILIRHVREKTTSKLSVRLLTVSATLLVFFLVQPVHAPFTYSFSLLPLGIALGLIDRERIILNASA